MPLREDAVKVAHKQVFVKSHIHGITADEALDLAAQIVSAANKAKSPFEPFAYYLDADGDFFIRNQDNDGWTDSSGEVWSDHFPTRPLVKLVPESEVN